MSQTVIFTKDLSPKSFWTNPKVAELIMSGLIEGIEDVESDGNLFNGPCFEYFQIYNEDKIVFNLYFEVETDSQGRKCLRIKGSKYYSDADLKKLKNLHEKRK